MSRLFWGVFCGFAIGAGVHADEVQETGSLIVEYMPRICIKEPCPQFDVVSVNGRVAEPDLRADLIKSDSETKIERKMQPGDSAMFGFKRITIVGSWVRSDSYIRVVKISEWKATVGEKFSDK